MADWGAVKMGTEQSKLKYVQSLIEGYAEKSIGPRFFQFMQSMMPEAVDVMKNYLNERPNWTETGQKRKSAGGNGPGRVDTGTMRDAISWKQIPTGRKGYYRFRVGWITGEPGYAIFQEQGTKNGVKAMNAIGYTNEWLRAEIALLGRGSNSVRTTNFRWKD